MFGGRFGSSLCMCVCVCVEFVIRTALHSESSCRPKGQRSQKAAVQTSEGFVCYYKQGEKKNKKNCVVLKMWNNAVSWHNARNVTFFQCIQFLCQFLCVHFSSLMQTLLFGLFIFEGNSDYLHFVISVFY